MKNMIATTPSLLNRTDMPIKIAKSSTAINIFSNPNPSFIQPNCRVLKKISFAVIKYTFMGYYAISTDGIYR
jgi:hypothetical protein